MASTGPIRADPKASDRSLRGLDWFAFFLADIQTGWGPFLAAYLTSVAWTQLDIGLVLTIGTLAAFAFQIPAGALVDRVPAKRFLAALAVACVSGSALLLALWRPFVEDENPDEEQGHYFQSVLVAPPGYYDGPND